MRMRRRGWLSFALLAAGCQPSAAGTPAAPTRIAAERQRCVECALRQHATHTHIDASEVFQQGCRDGDPRSCSVLGVMYEQGRGVPRDLDRAESLFRFACLEGNARACVSLGQRVEARDRGGAVALYDLACHRREPEGCRQLGQLRARRGDVAGASRAYARACHDGDGAGCEALAHMYRRGEGVRRDPDRARALYLRACARGRDASCRSVPPDHPR